MARNDQRKLFLFGRYSLALLLPKKWLKELGAEIGDLVNLKLEKSRGRVIISFGNSQKSKIPSSETTPLEGNSHDDFEPIPSL